MIRTIFLFLVSQTLITNTLFGQTQSAKPSVSPQSNQFTLAPDDLGKAASSVNLFNGEVSLPLPLGSVASRNGLSYTLNSAYSTSGVTEIATTWNREAPTGTLGLGWALTESKIAADNKQTGTREDDTYYLIEGGVSNKLVRIGGTSTTKEYATVNYNFWKIKFYVFQEKWEITREDGSIYTYGGTTNSTEWIVRWGNWIGNSSRASGQAQQGIGWHLS